MSDPYDDALLDYEGAIKTPDNAENILQRVAKSIGSAAQAGMRNMSPLGVSVNPKFPFLPTMPTDSPMLQAGMDEAQMPITKGNPLAQIGMGLASNALAYGKLGGGKAAEKVGNGFSAMRNPSEYLGGKIRNLQGENPSKGVNFLDIISKHQGDPFVDKVLDKSGVIEKFGTSSMDEAGSMKENLKNLPLQESQDLINDIKVGLTNTLREGNYKSNQRGLASMLKNLSQAQESAFPGISGAKSVYGFSKNAGKVGKDLAKKAISGAEWGAVGYPVYKLIKGNRS